MGMQETMILAIVYLVAATALVVSLVGVIFFGLRAHERGRRRKLVDSKRKIRVSSPTDEAKSCVHMRSRSRARTEADGSIVSICKKCGVQMRRTGPGEWEATA